MDAVDYRDDLRVSAGRMRWWREVEMWRKEDEEEEEELVEVLLRGKAPWGFTLRGGTERREPLVITKVEEGSAAAAVCLQVGDEMVSVNAVSLSGSRQEAICLVKSSHKTLSLGVRRKSRFKGKNDPGSRPQSWHSSKLTDVEPQPVWHSKHEARPKESSTIVNSMERPSLPPPPPAGRLSPPKHSAESLCGPGSKKDSGFSCFSSNPSPPFNDPGTSERKGTTSTENIFFKGPLSERPPPRYLQPTLGNGGWEGSRGEETPSSRVSVAMRPNMGPVWQVPEKKKSQSPPPPPPPPPLRSDSFAATKVFPYSEAKTHGRSFEKLTENNNQNGLRSHQEKTTEARRSLNPLPTKDFIHPKTASDHNHNQLHPDKLFSLSSNDVRQSHYTQIPAHQRQYSDESPLSLQNRSAPPTKIQSVGSYYRSLQDLPTRAFSRKHVRHSTASVANPNLENGWRNRYYGLANKHPVQSAELQARQGKAEGWRGETERPHRGNSCEPGFLGSNIKAKYTLPQSQLPYSGSHSHQGELSVTSRSLEDAAKRGDANDTKRYFPTHQSNDHKTRHQDPWVPQEDHRISPLKTPLLHSLAQEGRSLTARQPSAQPQEAGDNMASSGGKCIRRSDRYATVLRNEIQQKRAQLQKSRSAATLTCEAEDDEEAEEWRSTETSTSSGVSNTYKDHLKEAQARVLQATSFQRRDLEPLGPEATVVKTSNGRIRGRKRFPLAKRMHSFSEPDKIDKLGVGGEAQTGSFGDRKKLFEAKPAFSRPVLKSSQGSNLNTDLGEKQNERSGESEDALISTELEHLSPGDTQVLLEQQRLGTFAEYQATWSKQKKSSEAKTQGRYHSAENILDTEAEEKPVCIHERSRSSPSADFYTQNIPSPWIDPPSQQSSNRGNTESQQRYQADRSPHSAPSVPRIEGPADHRNKPESANSSHSKLSSGSLPPPPTKGLLPPPRLHLGAETTSSSSSSKEFLAPDVLSSCSSDSHNSSAGKRTLRGGENEVEKEKEQLSCSSSLRTRSPSPQFAPLRLTDKPPAVLVPEDIALRSENDLKLPAEMDVNSPVRKVPVRIVHSESVSERDVRAYLPQNSDTCIVFEPPTNFPSLNTAERPASSLFSAYTRQDPAPNPIPESSSAGGRPSVEDAKREELARDIMGKDKSLADILDQSGRKTTMDLMEGLFPTEEQVLEEGQQRKRASSGSRLPTSSPRSMDRREEEDASVSAVASLVPSSSYYNTSAPKAELLIKMKDMQEQLEDSEDELDVDLASKKQELISSLARKLEVLREARRSLQEDVEDNEALGCEVEGTVQRICQANQLDKFCMFVGDLDKVVSLLLSLSGRLARVENALNSLEEEAPPEEKRTLTRKRKLLMQQHEDAKELKENLDRRERVVSSIMETHLDAENLDDYRHFVKMKSALIIEQRKLEDKIHLGEEQLKCLLDSLPLDQRPML
ncbi:protein Shroom2 isoform X1 [Trematomus bernacchii]|uniref:protein Shroom2 isoform X1 n=2 Tax=Trematomus bernacchii TaxID=40690 RepID=UPI00146AB43C|nr:protein Shroom2 isoform X1 [Trematomus bernacchii]